jgi:nucleoside permease NupC
MKSHHQNVIDAAASGASEGMALAINVAAMLVAFLALIAMLDAFLLIISPVYSFAFTGEWEKLDGFNLEYILGTLLRPLAWVNGVPWGETRIVGELMGIKTIANEFVGYLRLQEVAPILSERSKIIATYALCGFANLGSIGILLGGLTILAPKRRADLAKLSIRALVAGTFACNATACVAAMLIS